jgi:hypothetical protein
MFSISILRIPTPELSGDRDERDAGRERMRERSRFLAGKAEVPPCGNGHSDDFPCAPCGILSGYPINIKHNLVPPLIVEALPSKAHF